MIEFKKSNRVEIEKYSLNYNPKVYEKTRDNVETDGINKRFVFRRFGIFKKVFYCGLYVDIKNEIVCIITTPGKINMKSKWYRDKINFLKDRALEMKESYLIDLQL